MEIWLRTNTRAVWFGTVLPAALGLLGLLLVVGLPDSPVGVRIVGGVLLAISLAGILGLMVLARKPRLAYADEHLLVWLGWGAPIRVPIQVVECFWLGQSDSLLPLARNQKTETSSVVVRIAERATEWHHHQVKPQFGLWCDGYITIRGTWCEPLSVKKVNSLNQRLSEVTRATAR